MRFLPSFPLTFLLALPAHAQVVGWADCTNTFPQEEFVSIHVAYGAHT